MSHSVGHSSRWFEKLSDEIIHVTACLFLDVKAILALSRVSHRLHGVVVNSAQLQYIVLLAKYGKEDCRVSKYSYSERLSLLKRHVEAWISCVPFSAPMEVYRDVGRGTPRVYVSAGFMVTVSRDLKFTVRVFRLPSPLRDVTFHAFPPWTLPESIRPLFQPPNRLQTVIMDLAVDVGVVVAAIGGGEHVQPCFFPFQLSTGRRTPLSSKELFIGEETLVFSERLLLGQDIMCMKGHYIMYHALLFEPAFPEAANGQGQAGHFFEAIVVFCMSKSHKVLQLTMALAAVFLSDRHVLALVVAPEHANRPIGPLGLCFIVYDLGESGEDGLSARHLARLDVPITIPHFHEWAAFLVGEQAGSPNPQGGLVKEAGAFLDDGYAIFRACFPVFSSSSPRNGISVPFSAFDHVLSPRSDALLPVHEENATAWSGGTLKISDQAGGWSGDLFSWDHRVYGAVASGCDFHPERVKAAYFVHEGGKLRQQDWACGCMQRADGDTSGHVRVYQDSPADHLDFQGATSANTLADSTRQDPPRWFRISRPSIGSRSVERMEVSGDVCVSTSVCPVSSDQEGDEGSDMGESELTVTVYPLCSSDDVGV